MAKKTKSFLANSKKYFRQKPKRVIGATFLLLVVTVVGFEVSRALLYQARIELYKQSEPIVSIRDAADTLITSIDIGNTAYFCTLHAPQRIENGQSEALYKQANRDIRPATLMGLIHENASVESTQVPTFHSALEFIPVVGNARETSDTLTMSLSELVSLSAPDERSDYCAELDTVLTRLYFLQDISLPQGVTALFPGQLEDLQARARDAQDYFLSLNPPANLRKEHVAINDFLNQMAVDLRAETNNPEQFARTIEQNNRALETILKAIREETSDLQNFPVRTLIAAEVLR